VALYIETTEKLAEGVLAFQATTTEWAKDTPLAVVLEAQHSMVLRRNGPSFFGGPRKSTQDNVEGGMTSQRRLFGEAVPPAVSVLSI